MNPRRSSIRSIVFVLAAASVAAACTGGSDEVAIPEATSAPQPESAVETDGSDTSDDALDDESSEAGGGDPDIDAEQPDEVDDAPERDVVDDTVASEPVGEEPESTDGATDGSGDGGSQSDADDDAVTNGAVDTTTTSAPATTAPPSDDTFLRIGDQGDAVALMQLKLRALGYLDPGYDSGQFDRATADALIDFQAQYGLVVDGIFGPQTDRSLTAAAASVNPEA